MRVFQQRSSSRRTLSFIVILACIVLSTGSRLFQLRPFRASAISIVAEDADESGDVGFYANVKKNVQIICRGSSAIFSDMKKAANIKKLKRMKGLDAISFTQYQFLEQSKGDLTKCFRLLVTIPLSPEFFFYSYIVFPLFSSSNPWAWRSLPSGFDDVRDVAVRETAINKRRQQTVVFGLHALQAETIDDGEYTCFRLTTAILISSARSF
jgi:hypothetical protein